MRKANIRRIRYLSMCILILLLPFMRYIYVGESVINLSYADFFLPVVFLLFYWTCVPRYEKGVRGYVRFITLLLVLMLLSVVNIVKWNNPSDAFRGYLTSILKFLICYAYVCVFGRFLSENPEKKRRILNLFLFSSLVNAAFAYIGIALLLRGIGNPFVYRNYFRACGSFNDPNLYACFLLLGIYVALYQLKRERKGRYLFFLFFQVGAVFLSASKAAMIALSILLVISFFSLLADSGGKIRLSYLLIIVASAAVFFIIFRQTDVFLQAFRRAGTILSSADTSDLTTGRIDIWRRGLIFIKDSPVFGVGSGMHGAVSRQMYLSSGEFAFHNTFLYYVVELGIFGLCWCLAGVGFLIKAQLRICRAEKNYALLGALGAVLFMAFTLDLENFRNLWIFFCLIVFLSSGIPGAGEANA